MPDFTSLENIYLANLSINNDKDLAISKAKQLLKKIGLFNRADHYPSQLSGGEAQRIRLASQIETRIASDKEKSIKLAQRKAYREALVQKVAAKMDDEKEASMDKNCEKCGGVYAGKGCEACGYASDKSEMKEAKAFSSAARKAFAAKALAEGFPIEYVNARLSEIDTFIDNLEKEYESTKSKRNNKAGV